MEPKSLTDILNDEPSEVQATVEAPEVVEKPRDEAGRFAKTGEDSGSPPLTEEPPAKEEATFDHAAVVAERRRRQEAEQRAATLEAQIQALQNPPQAPADIWEDTPAWQQQFGGQIVNTAVQQAELNSRVMMSEMLMRQSVPEFDDLKETYLKLERENPSIIPQVMNDPHPWNKAVQIARNHTAMQELGATDMEALKAKLREEIMAEQGGNPAPAPIPSLTGERNVGSRVGPAWSGPKSLSDILR